MASKADGFEPVKRSLRCGGGTQDPQSGRESPLARTPTTSAPESAVRALRVLLRRYERVQSNGGGLDSACCGLTYAQCHPLLEIGERGRSSVGELAEALDLDKSTLSRSVDGLVKRRLVRRRTDPRDRRYVVLTLTPRGREICDEINRKNDDYFDRVLRQLSASERRTLLRSLRRLVEAMEATARARFSGPPGGLQRSNR